MKEQGIHLNLMNQLRRHEGLSLTLYKCSGDPPKQTIGFGRNIEDNGISEAEAEFMLLNDLLACESELKDEGWYNQLDETRRAVVLNMAFNLGKPTLLKFKKFIKPAAFVMGLFMMAAIYFHVSISDPITPTIQSFVMFLSCLSIIYLDKYYNKV